MGFDLLWGRCKARAQCRIPTLLVAAGVVAGCAPAGSSLRGTPSPSTTVANLTGVHRIEHAVFIMQENRSFDHYFGTYPGADGFPRDTNGRFLTCVPAPTGPCVAPFHDASDVNSGGPHQSQSSITDINGGRMDGFIQNATNCTLNDLCHAPLDVTGYHDAREIPNYWRYAQDYVLQDRMFESVGSWSPIAHLYMVSAWSASCSQKGRPASCNTDIGGSFAENEAQPGTQANDYPWTDITYML